MYAKQPSIAVSVFMMLLLISTAIVTDLTAQEKAPFQDNLLSALFSEPVLRDLELVDDQQKQLKEILGELRQSRNQMITDIKEMSASGASKEQIQAERQKALEKLLSELSAEQRKKYKELIGDRVKNLR